MIIPCNNCKTTERVKNNFNWHQLERLAQDWDAWIWNFNNGHTVGLMELNS